MKRVRIAVIGAGIMGSLFAELLGELPECRLVAVADTNSEQSKAVGRRLNVPAYQGIEQVLQSEDVDAVLICTPEDKHLEPVSLAAARGKHIFLEKPIATTVADAEKIGRAAADAGVNLMVGHCLRFDPRFAAAHGSIQSGELGAVTHIRAWRETSIRNGQLYGKRTSLSLYIGVHDIDIMHWFTGSRVVRVFAQGAPGRLAELGIDDSLFSVLKFENGVVASLCNSWALPQTQDRQRSTIADKGMEVLATSGMINIEAENIGIRVQTERDIEYPDILYSPAVQGQRPGILRDQLRHFVRSILEGFTPAIGAAVAAEAVKVAVAIDRSRKEGVAIDLV
jgi:predicted dehydrogenase